MIPGVKYFDVKHRNSEPENELAGGESETKLKRSRHATMLDFIIYYQPLIRGHISITSRPSPLSLSTM